MRLTRGANTAVATGVVRATLRWQSGHVVDIEALLVDAGGRVRSDADFVFFNAPRHPSGAVHLSQTGSGARVTVDLPKVEPDIVRIVLAGSLDVGTFSEMHDVGISLEDATGGAVADFPVGTVKPVSALVFGELYRRGPAWKFRAIGQGWANGLAGLARDYGVDVDESGTASAAPPETSVVQRPSSPPPTTAPHPLGPPSTPPRVSTPQVRADWYPDATNPALLRWWDGRAWTAETRMRVMPSADVCDRCGLPKRRRVFGATSPCRSCKTAVAQFMSDWRTRAMQVLSRQGPFGPDWDRLWLDLRYQQISSSTAEEALRPLAISHLERLVAFAFADGAIEPHEIDQFERATTALNLHDPAVDNMRSRLQRGRELTRIRDGDLPRLQPPGLHLETDEFAHLDVPVTQVRYLASGSKLQQGRLIASNKKLRFVGASAGTELPWAKVVSISAEHESVVVAATTARGGGSYRVSDPDYVAAVLEGALRIAKRLVLVPGQRDSRTIPPEVKSAVWQRDGGQCVQCGAHDYLEFDHAIPRSRGGATSISNLQILCRRCNQEKGARL